MKHLLNLFGGADIGSGLNTFFHARIRLTILYTIVFGTLILILSGILYYFFAADIHEDMRSIYPDNSEQTRIINQHKIPLRNFMIVIDGVLILFTFFASYYLTGITLKPIQKNIDAQKQFIANASHELRTPIAILKADLEVYLNDKKLSRTIRPLFRGYLEEVNHMKHIVENLMMLFRFESHQISLKQEKVFLKELIINSMNKMKSYAHTKNITFHRSISQDLSICADAFLIQQAFRNILKNAIEYSDSSKTVKVFLTKRGNMADIRVIDHGIGIEKEHLEHVFDRFYRTESSKNLRSEGMGLGLSIVQQIVKAHGGSLHIQSVPQKGTQVTMSFPLYSS